MSSYAIFDASGNYLYTAGGSPPVPDPTLNHQVLALTAPLDPANNTYTLAGGALVTTPVNVLTLAQSAAVAAAQAVYDGLIAAGFTYQGVLYQIDPTSQAQMAAMAIAALGTITDPTNNPAWPANFTWIAANNTQTPMTAAVMYAFARAVAGYVSNCILNLRAIKNTILAATSQAAVAAIAVGAGYPAASA